jgi:hypothetical protein
MAMQAEPSASSDENVAVEATLSDGVTHGGFDGAPDIAALHLVTVARGLAVLERAFDNEARLRDVALSAIDFVLGADRRK